MNFDLNWEDIPTEKQQIKRRNWILSLLRIGVFFLMITLLILGIAEDRLILLLLIPAVAAFVYLIKKYNLNKAKGDMLTSFELMQVEKTQRDQRDLKNLKQGLKYMDKNHPFCNDLDLFGEHSLYQLVNHTVNPGGANLLATWMKAPMDKSESKARHEAIQELRGHTDFLRDFEVVGRTFIKGEKSKKEFYKWTTTPKDWKSFYYLPLVAGPLVGLGVLIGTLYLGMPIVLLSIWIAVGLVALSLIFKKLQKVPFILPNEGDIKTYRIWAELLEKVKFQDKYLQHQQAPFTDENKNISVGLKKLEQLTFLVQNRFNLVFVILNLLFWFDFYLLYALNKWKTKFGADISHLDEIYDKWQVMTSMGVFSQEENLKGKIEYSENSELEAKNMWHPLLKKGDAVANDFSFPISDRLILLTGSNMSGKTTFMRTIGINMVMVNLGLAPCAENIILGPFELFTSMRNTDNLGESVSSFYAELARIRTILTASDAGKPVFFLMDEILKGTNTTDRIMGSEALIKQLAAANSKGIISTHDIELSELESNFDYLKNYSFHSEIMGDTISFDYKLKRGPCPSFNAHKLMELMGIRFN